MTVLRVDRKQDNPALYEVKRMFLFIFWRRATDQLFLTRAAAMEYARSMLTTYAKTIIRNDGTTLYVGK